MRDVILKRAEKQIIQKTQGNYPAPLAIIETLRQNLSLPMKEALAVESEQFGQLTVSPQAKQLIQLYFATTAVKNHQSHPPLDHQKPSVLLVVV